MLKEIIKSLKKVSTKERAQTNAWFFKTGKGQYGEGDTFIGVSVPDIRLVAKKYANADLETIQDLLCSPLHEVRLCALVMLVNQFQKITKVKSQQSEAALGRMVKFYLAHTKHINNWDLVDTSAYKIIGAYLIDKKDRKILYKLAQSKNLWERRIAIVSTFAFIRENDLDDTYRLAEMLMNDTHDLTHKAVGWMLREAGKRDQGRLEVFLTEYIRVIPRTTLRYAIEKFTKRERARFLAL